MIIRNIVLVFAITLLCYQKIGAQDSDLFLVQVIENQFALYDVKSSGAITPMTRTNEVINTALDELDSPKLQSPSDVVIADNGNRIALVAYDLYNYSDFVLLTYAVETDTFQITPIVGYGRIQWIQDGQSILLSPSPTPPVYNDIANIHDIFLYDWQADALHQITDTEYSESDVIFVPSTELIVFTHGIQDYEHVSVEDLYSLKIDGTGISSIASIESILPDQQLGRCAIEKMEWNRENERLYFVVVCDQGDFLVSTSLTGDIKLEFETSLTAPKDAFLTEARLWQYHIDATRNQVWIVVTSDEVLPDRPESVKTIYIYQLLSDMSFEEVYKEAIPNNHYVTKTNFNAKLNQLVVGTIDATSESLGSLRVIDLEQGQRIALLETEQRVCEARWLVDRFILYDQVIDGFCRGVANRIEIWDLVSNTVELLPMADGLQIVTGH